MGCSKVVSRDSMISTSSPFVSNFDIQFCKQSLHIDFRKDNFGFRCSIQMRSLGGS
jgi:hypothetical protein